MGAYHQRDTSLEPISAGEEAPVRVANHIGTPETMLGGYFVWSPISMKDAQTTPLLGGAMRGLQAIFVDRTDPQVRILQFL